MPIYLCQSWHDDHYGDTDFIAKANDALVISTAEVAGKAAAAGCRTHAMHLGGKFDFEFGSVRMVPAFHGAGIPGGHAAGCIVNFYGDILYFAGDTALFSDMKLLNRFGEIDYAFFLSVIITQWELKMQPCCLLCKSAYFHSNSLQNMACYRP